MVIDVGEGSYEIDGSCDACSRIDNPNYRKITVVELARNGVTSQNEVTFRLCEKCRKELIKKLHWIS